MTEHETHEDGIQDADKRECARCRQPIESTYYLAGGNKLCPRCRDGLAGQVGQRPGLGLFCRAAGFGIAGALLGAALWALVVIATGYQLGLIAVLVGVLVGHAVRLGARRRSGRSLQVLAVLLTFLGLSWSTIPILINEIRENPEFKKSVAEGFKRGQPKPDAGADPSASEGEVQAAVEALPVDSEQETAKEPGRPGTGAFLLGIVVLVGVVLLGPVVVYGLSLAGDPFSLIFLGIALWEAWRLNRTAVLEIDGPFEAEGDIDFGQAEFSSE